MALSSASTLQNALDQFADNLSWEGDSAKAVLYLESIRWIMVRRAFDTKTADGKSVSFSESWYEKEMERVQPYVKTSSANAKRSSFTRGRALMP